MIESRKTPWRKLVSAIENTGADMAVCGYEWVNGQDECIMRKIV